MLPFALVALLICFAALKALTRTHVFSNFSIFLGLWIMLLALYHVNLAGFDPLGMELQMYLAVFFGIYSLVYYCTTLTQQGQYANVQSQLRQTHWFRERNHRFMIAFFILWALMFMVFIRSVGVGGLVLLLLEGGARSALRTIDNVNIWFYLFGYLFLISAAYQGGPKALHWRAVWIVACVVVLSSMLLTAAKINFVSAAFLFYVVWYNSRPRPRVTVLTHGAISIVCMYAFVFLQSVYSGKVVDAAVGSATGLSDVFRYGVGALLYPYEYFVSSLAALNEVFFYTERHDYAPGSVSFFSVYQIFLRFGLLPANFDLPPQFQSFVTVGTVRTNVYSLFYDLILDFGLFASMLLAVGLGVLHAFLDQAEVHGSRPEVLILSEISKLSAFLSFINFRYGDTIIVLAVVILCLILCWRLLVGTPFDAPTAPKRASLV